MATVNDNGSTPLLLSVTAAARLPNIGRALAYQLVQENRLPHLRLGRRVLVARPALEAWIAREVAGPGEAGVFSDHMTKSGVKEE